MKYYHVIYTSSQRLLSGGNGFGIRTATEGTPQEYLQHVVSCVTTNKFNNNVDTCDKMPSASALMENDGKAIHAVPPRYFYLQETVNDKPLYIVGRNIYLGFTEPFYFRGPDGQISGKSCRTGNFLLDLYLFEQQPTRNVFQILYEHPEDGKSQFVPKDAAPSTFNDEVAGYATGDPVVLPVSEWPFSDSEEALRQYDADFLQNRDVADRQKAVELLFALIEARLSERKLVVKYPWQQTPQLIADVIKLLPDNRVGTFTFSTYYTGNGYSVPADVNFVNEYYKVQYVGKDLLVDLSAAPLSTKESDAYKQIVLDALSRGDIATVRQLADWMLSAAYKEVRNLKAHTNKTLFIYTQQPKNFSLRMLHEAEDAQGHRTPLTAEDQRELLSALNKCISENPAVNQRRFVELLTQDIQTALGSADETIRVVGDIETYKQQIPLAERIAAQFSSQIENGLITGAPKQAIKSLGLRVVRAYTHDLDKGLGNPELADAIVSIEREHVPHTMDEAFKLIGKYKDVYKNPAVVGLLAGNFREFFGGLYDTVVETARRDRKKAADSVEQLRNLLTDTTETYNAVKNDTTFQQFGELYSVLSDDVEVSAANYRGILDLLQRTGMVQASKTAEKVKNLLFQERSLGSVALQTLRDVWHMDSAAIISKAEQLAAAGQIGPDSLKNFVKQALEVSGLKLKEVMEWLQKYKLSDDEVKAFLTTSEHYKSAYKAYSRKQLISNIFGKIAGIFQRKPKTPQPPAGPQPPAQLANRPKTQPSPRPATRPAAQPTTRPGAASSRPSFNAATQELDAKKKSDLNRLQNLLERNEYNKSTGKREIPLNDLEALKNEVDCIIMDCRRLGQEIPESYKKFDKYVTTLLVLLCMTLFGSLDARAAGQNEYHSAYGDVKDAQKCYIVNAKTLNVRTSPSLYKGKRKKTKRKDNVGFQLSQGDTVFVNSLAQPMTADGVEWIGFTHDGKDYYTDITKLYTVDNPRLQQEVVEEKSGGFWGWLKGLFSKKGDSSDDADADADIDAAPDTGGFLSWLQRAAPTILLLLTITMFVIWALAMWFDDDTDPIDYFRAEVRDDTGMRPMFMYSLRPYKTAVAISLALLFSFILSILVMLILGGIVWGFLWIVKLLLWALIVIGWILVVVGVICIFVNWAIAIPALIVGGLITHFQETLEAWGNSCVDAGMAFFDAINVWDFSVDLIQRHGVHAILISAIPMVLFLVAAIVVFLVALGLRGYEAWTTHRYNVKNPCPICKEPSEPARYFVNQTDEGELPTQLRPGIYGLLHVTHPKTGTRMPTLIANGRDQLLRACPHCSNFINFRAGTEKHIGFVGMPESGKTTLLCSIVGEMKHRNRNMEFTGISENIAKDFRDSVDYYIKERHLDDDHLPQKTQAVLKSSTQCTLPRTKGGLPYHLYFDDVAGELFTSSGNDQSLLLFAKTVENIIFIVDPMTMELELGEVSPAMKRWLQQPDVATARSNRELQDGLVACDSIANVLTKYNRDLSEIDFTFALVKSDMGYLGDTRLDNPDALRRFMTDDMALPNLISKTKGYRSVNFVAVSVYEKNNKGIHTLCDNLEQQLGLNQET